MAKEGKGGFVILNDVLYHKDKVEDQLMSQFCLPQSRRVKVLKLAHDSVFGGHMGEKRHESEFVCLCIGQGYASLYMIMSAHVRAVSCVHTL